MVAMMGTAWLAAVLSIPMGWAQEGTVSFGGGDGPPDYYIIQEGDTLWDISTRFLGDPYAWPELWSLNEYVTNPHWIYPGNRIYFRLGDDLDAPGAVPYEKGEPAPAREGPLCDLPNAFTYTRRQVNLFAPGIISTPTSRNVVGKVYSAFTEFSQLSEEQYVSMRVQRGQDITCGQRLGIFRELNRKVRIGRINEGRLYRAAAVVEVVRVDGNIVTARVEDSYYEFERGDVVGDPIPVDYTMDIRRPNQESLLEASVIARIHPEIALASTGETIFIDQGTDDGIKPGAALYLVESRDGQDWAGPEDLKLPDLVVGRVVVVYAEERWATGVVVDASAVVDVGDRLTTIPNAD